MTIQSWFNKRTAIAAVVAVSAGALALPVAQAEEIDVAAKSSARISAVINFEILDQPCSFIGVNPLRDKYKGLGVHFSGPGDLNGAAILDECSNFGVGARSGEAFLAVGNTALANGGNANGPITIRFDNKQGSVGVWIAPGGAGTESFKLIGKRGGEVVRSSTLVIGTNTFQEVKISAKKGFGSVVIRSVSSDDFWLVDDLSITSLAN